MGKQIISCYRTGVAPLLTPSEIEMFAIESVLRMKMIKDFELANQYIHSHCIRK